jgi:hypothetical protein
VRHSVLISVGISGLLFLRAVGLREPLYTLLLICCLVSLELSSQKR